MDGAAVGSSVGDGEGRFVGSAVVRGIATDTGSLVGVPPGRTVPGLIAGCFVLVGSCVGRVVDGWCVGRFVGEEKERTGLAINGPDGCQVGPVVGVIDGVAVG